MGNSNSNELDGEYVSEEEFNELLRREKHKKKKEAHILFKHKMKKIYHNSKCKDNLLMIYYGETRRFLNEFLDYNIFELVCGNMQFLNKMYNLAMCNYIRKWYSNSKC